MKQGMTLNNLAAEVLRRESTKKDFIVGSELLSLSPEMALGIPGKGEFPVTDFAHGQVAEFADIPKRHYDRLRTQAPHLLSAEVNHFLHSAAQPRMVRTLDGKARSLLSNRYRRLDNFDTLEAVLPQIINDPGLVVMSCDITETRLYMKVVKPSTEAEIVKGDPCHAGFVLKNSEVGAGSISVHAFINILACSNGMTVDKFGTRRNHVGRLTEQSENYEIFTEATIQLSDQSFWAQIKDTVAATLDEAKAGLIFGHLREAAGRPITGSPEACVKELSNRFQLSEEQRGGVLRNLIDNNHGRGLNQWALANSLTALANDEPDYDTASHLEDLGGRVLSLAPADWKAIGAAA